MSVCIGKINIHTGYMLMEINIMPLTLSLQ